MRKIFIFVLLLCVQMGMVARPVDLPSKEMVQVTDTAMQTAASPKGVYVSAGLGLFGEVRMGGLVYFSYDQRDSALVAYTDYSSCGDTIVTDARLKVALDNKFRRVSFYPDGALESEGCFLSDGYGWITAWRGRVAYYYESGFLKRVEDYEQDGDLRVVRRYADGSGLLQERVSYDCNGELTRTERYDGTGALSEVVEYEDGTNDVMLDYQIKAGHVQRTEKLDSQGVRWVTLSNRENAARRQRAAMLGINRLNGNGVCDGWWKGDGALVCYQDGVANGLAIANGRVLDVYKKGKCVFQCDYTDKSFAVLFDFNEQDVWRTCRCVVFRENGSVQSEGMICFFESWPCEEIIPLADGCRQTGRWVYYNPDGTVARTRDFVGDDKPWDLEP